MSVLYSVHFSGIVCRSLSISHVTEKVTNVTENVIEKLTDRQRKIVKIVEQYPFTTTSLMAQKLGVSIMTIRRDIEKMSHVIHHVGPDYLSFFLSAGLNPA